MNESYDTVSRDGVAKKGNTSLGFIPGSVEFTWENNAPFGQSSTDELDSVPGTTL